MNIHSLSPPNFGWNFKLANKYTEWTTCFPFFLVSASLEVNEKRKQRKKRRKKNPLKFGEWCRCTLQVYKTKSLCATIGWKMMSKQEAGKNEKEKTFHVIISLHCKYTLTHTQRRGDDRNETETKVCYLCHACHICNCNEWKSIAVAFLTSQFFVALAFSLVSMFAASIAVRSFDRRNVENMRDW